MTIGWKTLNVGDEALVYDVNGKSRVEEGPKRIYLFREEFIRLDRWFANQNEYLRVKFTNGRVEHIPGPCVVYKNPMIHKSIEKCQGIPLDANELLVVYNKPEGADHVTRRLQYGPTIFMPTATEWLHEFVWHGCDPVSRTSIQPKKQKFTKLQSIPNQFYYNIDEVRTLDDAVMKVKLMIFYELKDVERMLETTLDPIGDIINCICADVVHFTMKYTYIEFIENSSLLNHLETYHELLCCSPKIGVDVTKVVYRGCFTGEKLQRIHDSALDARTKLKIQKEAEEQNQALIDMKLTADMARADTENSLQLEELKYKHKIENLQLEHELTLATKEMMSKIKQAKLEHEAKLQTKRTTNQALLTELHRLKDLGVNLDTYLHSQFQPASKITHIYGYGAHPDVHLHK